MNKLEDAMSNMSNIQDSLDTLIYAIGDAPRKYTEDELLNMLMGASQLHQTCYDNLWMEYENFKREHQTFDEDDIFNQNSKTLRTNNNK
jgi:hypothetical protein